VNRLQRILALAILAVGLATPAAAQADEFGFVPGSVSAVARNQNGTLNLQAGSHPYSYSVSFALNSNSSGFTVGGQARNLIVQLPPGLIGNPKATPQCSRAQFEGGQPKCPAASQIGILQANIAGLGEASGPVYNLEPPPGSAGQIAFSVVSFNSLQLASVQTDNGYGIEVGAYNLPLEAISATETIWGVPADKAHNSERLCGGGSLETGCASAVKPEAFLTLPTQCSTPPEIRLRANSQLTPDVYAEESAPVLAASGQPSALFGCSNVPFSPKIAAAPTSRLAQNPSGLDFELTLPNQGLTSPGAVAETQPETTEVALPEGITLNPSAAEGLATCSPAQYAAETADSAPGEGCPEGAKLGSLVARSPLLDEAIEGSLYLATPHDNPFDSLIALYMVGRAPERGVLVKQAGVVRPDPVTGQLVTTFSDLPPVPYSSFDLHFREGGRAPLVTPQACGSYQTTSNLTPFSRPGQPKQVLSSFQIERGSDGGACPAAGTPSFHPGLLAGTINNAAGRYSPFNVRLTRTDGEQEFTHFSIKLPPGLVGKLAGIPFCSDLSVAAAKAREREGGGAEELAAPSCPAASQIGRTLVGAGVGGVLTYVPGKLYLAGPYHGSPLSIIAITAAKVGPFDVGTVVIREALKVNPETAEVFVDATGSDPIPHIIDGVPVHARDIRIYVDRPNFVLNPTSCKRTSTASTVLGSGTDFTTEADDQPVTVTSPFQAADCASLGFKPKLKIVLKGGTKRNANPIIKAVVTARPGDANVREAQVALPRSEFLDQGHIRTICTRVQFREGTVPGEKCPAGSIYGRARAVTPLLDEPLSGPVYLRANGGERPLPDMVTALNSGKININLVGRIDTGKGGGIRTSFEGVPDAAVTKFVLEMRGGKKGLLVNSVNLCKRTHRAVANFTAQNGRIHDFNPVVRPLGCKGKRSGKKGTKKQSRRGLFELLRPRR
jgi:hypothetical protein